MHTAAGRSQRAGEGSALETFQIQENENKVETNMIKTEITRMLGIQYPLFQGGMAWVADAKLAAAVSNA